MRSLTALGVETTLVRPITRLRQALSDLEAFTHAFEEYSRHHIFADKDEQGREVIHLGMGVEGAKRRVRVNRLAAPAQRAVDLADSLQSMPSLRTIEPRNWEGLDGFPFAQRDALRSVLQQSVRLTPNSGVSNGGAEAPPVGLPGGYRSIRRSENSLPWRRNLQRAGH